MTSIRARLIVILVAATGAVWLSAVVWIYLSTQAEVERVLDARLTEAARMVNSLLTDHRIEIAAAEGVARDAPPAFDIGGKPYERQLSCQIWSLDGALVGRSEGAPETRLTNDAEGFSETVIDGETWRVYTVENETLGVRVMVGDSVQIRDRLVGDVIKGLLLPALLILPIMIGLIWLSVRRGLSPLSDMAATLSSRTAHDLRPLPNAGAPSEIAPAVSALNGLFKRVEDARERERSFTAFAAHELKTPLAGLKTQAQIALASADGAVHANALRQISSGVDRTSRLVKQLLDLATIEAGDAVPILSSEEPVAALKAVVADLQPLARNRNVTVTVDGTAADIQAFVEPQFFVLSLRNLVENAILHSPDGGSVRCRIAASGNEVIIVVEDEGPGMSEAELPRATKRFFRGRNKAETGSGLGLSIVELAMTRIGGTLSLANREPRGLSASMVIRSREARA